VFRFTRLTASEIEEKIAATKRLAPSPARVLKPTDGMLARGLPGRFAHDRSRSLLGRGDGVFSAAKRAFAHWRQFDFGWAHVANPQAKISAGEIVAVEVRSLGLWTLNLSRIVETVDSPDRFGFVYATTEMHVEEGEERFLLRRDEATGEVWYELEAVSRPRDALARIGYPVTRAFQRRFARDSHRRMQSAIDIPGKIS
jgi:uncharacterized protein (UPF0548 family)